MRAVISVVGKDHPGILAFVASKCAEKEINIVDVTQKVLQGLFTMMMIVETTDELHKKFTGVSNGVILDNLALLNNMEKKKVWIFM